MNAPLPPNERERLQNLRRYAILDTPPEAVFDRVTRMVARLLKVPISTVTLVDEHRQWFKSHHGLDVRESSREQSFCAYAILSDTMTVVSDATQDERFHDNVLVAGDPNIRFYAGAPLQSAAGFTLGTLCAIDTRQRELNAEERETLRDLAAIVTDELELRLAVRERRQQAAAISQVSFGVVMTEPNLPDNPIVFANPAFLRMTGYPTDEIVGTNCRVLQGPKSDPQIAAMIREAVAARRTFQGELLNYRKDGTPFWNELTISPVFDDAGELISFVGLQADVTERKRIANLLRQNFEKLKELEALRDNLTAMLIHDLRSPLTTVIGFLDILQTIGAEKLTEKEQQFIEYARNGAAALADTITSLLDISRLEAGEMPINKQQVDLREIITTATVPFGSILGARSLKLDLPAAPVEAHCDAELVQRVVTNLVSNAVKFTPDGGEIRVSTALENGKAKVSVTDTGTGIPAEYHARIFEKFGQVEGHKHRHSTGMGLAFCKLAIEAHDGAIGVQSTEGRGTTVWFVI